MPKELVISAAPHETRVAILEDGQLCEIYIEREKEFALVGSIYKGRVTRVLPGMQSAFVDIGLDSDAFLYVGDFLENLEDYDHVVHTVEDKVEKMEQQGGVVFAPEASAEGSSIAGAAGRLEKTGPAAFEPAADDKAEQPHASPPNGGESAAQSVSQQVPPASQPGFRQDHRQGQGRWQGQRNDRSGGQRSGRFRRGRGDRRGGRDLPPSKYASPRPYTPSPSRPYEPPTEEESAARYEPVILPGESLAKYKDRAPATLSVTPAGPAASGTTPAASEPAAPPATSSPVLESPRGFPEPLYAQPERAELSEPSDTQAEALQAGSIFASDEYRSPQQSLPEESLPPVLHESSPSISPRDISNGALAETLEVSRELGGSQAHGSPEGGPELSDEEITALAEQLAEARQEEATAEADTQLATAEGSDEDSAEEAGEPSEDSQGEESRGGQEKALAEPSSVEAAPEGDNPAGGTNQEIDDSEGQDAILPSRPAQRPLSARISDPQRARFQRPVRRGSRHGNRPYERAQSHRQQPSRRPQLISEMLKAGQEIIVQIAKEPLGKKGARITSHVALPGRFLVYMPTVNHIGVSRRIGSAEERSRLRRLVIESKGSFPGGFIVRTAAEGTPEEEIRSDVEFLGRTWEKIRTQAEPRKSPALLHRDLNLVERILRDYVSNDYSAVWIDNEEEFSKVVEFVGRFQPKLVSRVKLYTKPMPIFEEFGIQQELDKALRPKVWLKSGGYIVINHTEALVAIDVNTGKYVGRGSTRLEDTIVKTNLEAVKEIIRQIRLRDLGGIIVLDFIDMEERRNRDKVMSALEAALRADRAPSKALPFNEFGLVAVTRKRTKQALERVLCQPCPYCTGSGMVKSVPTICYEIQAEAKKMSADLEATSLTLRVHPEIAKALKTREAALIEELEQGTRKSVIIQADPTLHWEQYDIY